MTKDEETTPDLCTDPYIYYIMYVEVEVVHDLLLLGVILSLVTLRSWS